MSPPLSPPPVSGTGQTMAAPGEGRPTLTAATAILFVGVIASFALFILVFFLYLRAKRYWGAIPGRAVPVPPAAARCGLDASAVAGLPSVVFRGDRVEEGVECAVCLCELAEGEAARLLPRCGHAFHLECIDMWFSSHSTCPLCRGAVVAGYPEHGGPCSAVAGGVAQQEESSPPEILASPMLCPSEEGSSGASGSSSGIEMEAPLSSPLTTASVLTEEEATARLPLPQAAALRSWRRLLVRGGRAGVGGDVEQGSVRGSKAPTSS